jgi:glucose/arabinose dehydrogenase
MLDQRLWGEFRPVPHKGPDGQDVTSWLLLPPRPPADAPDAARMKKGFGLIETRHCTSCHGRDFAGHQNVPRVVIDGLPKQVGHFWKFLSMGPDGKLYFNIGAPCNICIPSYIQGTISRVDVKTGKLEEYARGVRNSVGFDWHPKTKQLWFTEHGRDWMGDDMPSDELNVVKTKGQHFGYPFCHQGDTPDPEFGKYRSCAEFTPPALKLGAHVAPLGMRFYTGKMFPAEYQNSIFLARHGSWNRTVKHGYDVIRVSIDQNGKAKAQPFLEGFLVDAKADPPTWGRPVDVLVMRDGALLVSDDYNGILYRVSYKK